MRRWFDRQRRRGLVADEGSFWRQRRHDGRDWVDCTSILKPLPGIYKSHTSKWRPGSEIQGVFERFEARLFEVLEAVRGLA